MRNVFSLLLIIALIAMIAYNLSSRTQVKTIDQSKLTNPKIKEYAFLSCMYQDPYFPTFLVDKCRNILLNLCSDIETKKPGNLNGLYTLTHASTKLINNLESEFLAHDSEIETTAAECLAVDFEFVATAYGFEADIEELIATRNW